MYSTNGALETVGQQQVPEWYRGLQSWFGEWQTRMQKISDILKETPAPPAQQQAGTQQTVATWLGQPLTWAALGIAAFGIYKWRTARK